MGIRDLGGWFKKRLDEAEQFGQGAWADINLFDAGRSHGNMNPRPAPPTSLVQQNTAANRSFWDKLITHGPAATFDTVTNPTVYRDATIGTLRGLARIPETASRSWMELTGGQPQSAPSPTDPFRRLLYGSEPLETYQKRAEGIHKSSSAPGGMPTVSPLMAGLALPAMDLTPGGRKVPQSPAMTPRNAPLASTTSSVRVQGPPTPPPPSGVKIAAPEPLPPRGPTTQVKLNTSRLNISDQSRQQLDTATAETIPRLSNKEVEQFAKSAGLDLKSHTIDQTRAIIAKQLALRQRITSTQKAAEDARIGGDTVKAEQLLRQAADFGRTSRSQGTDVARQLQARAIIANEMATPQQRIFQLLDEAGVNPDVYIKRFANVDFNDAKQVVAGYRDLVPAKFGDWIDTVRYNSMLSSPLTQAVNIVGNVGGVMIAPVEKTIRGLFSKNYAAGEGVAYAGGAARNIRQAVDNALETWRGNQEITNLDIALQGGHIPVAVGGVKGGVASTLSIPTRALGAFDKLFRTIAEGGEQAALNVRAAKGIKIKGNVPALLEQEAAYRVFQAESHIPGQGALLDAADSIAGLIMRARNSESPIVSWAAKFSAPFVKTINNIGKQGMVEYSPLGYINALSAADKATALTRASIGTAVFGLGGMMVGAGEATWGEPRSPEEKAAFRAEGKQPYSIKIGDKWIQYSKLPPWFSFPFALSAGIRDALDNKRMSESTADAILLGVAQWGEFLSDQSYLKNVGDTLAALKGDTEKVAAAVSNYPQQIVPFRALSGWIARMTDGTDRKLNTDTSYVNQQVQSFMLQYPWLRQKVDHRIDPFTGQPLAANNPIFNNLSPVKITTDRGFGNTSGLNIDQRQMMRDLPENQRGGFRQGIMVKKDLASQDRREQEQFKKQTGSVKVAGATTSGVKQLASGKFYAKVGSDFKTFDTEGDAKKALFVEGFKSGKDKIKQFGNQVYLKAKNEQGYSVMSKAQYDFNQNDSKLVLEMDRAKASDDVGRWFGAAEQRYNAMDALRQSYDPETEADKIADITLKMENLLETAEKYKEYGGFKKGKKGRSLPKVDVAISQDLMSPVVPKGAINAPAVRIKNRGTPSVKVSKSKVKIKAPKKLKA